MLDTGVTGEDLDSAERLHHVSHQVMGLWGVADVGAEGGDLVTFIGQLGDEFVGGGSVGDVVDRDCRAVGRQAPRNRRADATTATGDQRAFPGQPCLSRHGTPLVHGRIIPFKSSQVN